MIGITEMYKDIGEMIGVKYRVVNPYKEKVNCSILIISKGYKERVKKLNPEAKIFEVRAATFRDLIESLEMLKEIGDEKKIEESIRKIREREREVKKLLKRKAKVNPKSKFLERIALDLNLEISEDGIELVPDYLGGNIRTHRYDLGLIERIEDRYRQVIEIINSFPSLF
ncbi:conserved hypothetical protein [Methanocaldococcus infernus ME]|uniref:Uncharacterized protein n=1 Tax=Methanocaldococcus infernus (strain DSM 11812 / JCM 15783 / ME) TaxID=573063 RepID=D5VRY7_METIM|nr:conserved hypothetical protein [Methanocaldococcus infernus ME]